MLGVHVVVMPEGEDGNKVTVPVNPPRRDMVIVEDAVLPTVNDTEAGLALSPKSGVVAAVAVTATEAE